MKISKTDNTKVSKLQRTKKGYYQMNIPKELKETLQWRDESHLELQAIDGRLVVVDLRRSR